MGQETEQQRRREDFASLQVNDALVALAPPGVRVMHCLPAHRGEEITDAVIDGPAVGGVRPGGEPPLGAAGAARAHLLARRVVGVGRVSDFLRNAHFFLQSLSWRDGLDVLVVAVPALPAPRS